MNNALESHIVWHELSEVPCMNQLQDAGVISDNCVLANDVCYLDCNNAIAFLKEQHANRIYAKPTDPPQAHPGRSAPDRSGCDFVGRS